MTKGRCSLSVIGTELILMGGINGPPAESEDELRVIDRGVDAPVGSVVEPSGRGGGRPPRIEFPVIGAVAVTHWRLWRLQRRW